MKLTFIGTGNMGSTTRANTSILVDNILFDCGMGTIKQLERLGKKVKDLDYLVISHFHADHFFDIPNLIIGKKIRGEIEKPFYIIGPKGISQKVNDLMVFAFGNLGSLKDYANIEFIELESNEELTINDYTLISIDLVHGKATPNYGYLLKKGEVVIGYTGDSTLCDNFTKMCENADIIITDTTRKEKSDKGHIGLADLTSIADQYANCKFYAVHRLDYELPTNSKVIFPQDGDEVEIQ